MGWRQKREILKFVKLLNPSVVFGTNSAAIDRLRREGIHAEYLYLFGNILTLRYLLVPRKKVSESHFLALSMKTSPMKNLMVFFQLYPKLMQKKLEIVLIGRQREDEGTARVLSLCKKNDFLIEKTGELSTTQFQ